MKIKIITQLSVTAASLLLAITSVSAIDLQAQYPTDFVAGDTKPENALPWDFKPEDIYHVSQFNLSVGTNLTVTLGSADLGIGHSTNGAVWAVLIPREEGTLASSVTTENEPIANVWLRFHPAQIDRLFPPDTVTADGERSLEKAIRFVADAKMDTSWQSDRKAMIPEPKDLTVYVDTKAGDHRFFAVDTDAKSAEYVAAFNRKSGGGAGQISATSIPPVVIKTAPESGATDIPAGETEIRVTFSKPMMDGSWSWSTAWQDSTPDFVGNPAYDTDGKTCVVKVKLEAGKTYGFWLNSQKFKNFKDKQGRSSVPYLLVFQTAGSTQSTETKPPKVDSAPASKDTWAPEIEPGQILDLQKILTQAKELIDLGRYEEALQRYIWYHNHALEHDPGQAGVRLSFVLADWIELGRKYPKARQALVEIRDRDTQRFYDGQGNFNLFMDVQSINNYLGEDDATYALFKNIERKDKALAQLCFFAAEGLLVGHHEYNLCFDYIGDPQSAFERLADSRERLKAMEDQRAAQREQQRKRREAMGQTNPAFAHLPFLPETPKFADRNFVDQTRQLIEILVGANHRPEAEKIRDEALGILKDDRLKSAIKDAEKNIRKAAEISAGSGPLAASSPFQPNPNLK